MAARRATHKQPEIEQLMQDLYNVHEEEHKPGTQTPNFRLQIPRPRHKPIAPFNWPNSSPRGHIARLLQQSQKRCCSIRPGWMLQPNHHSTVGIMHSPINHLKTITRKVNATADFWAMALPRPAFGLHWEFDINLTLALTRTPIPTLPGPNEKRKKPTRICCITNTS